MVNTTFHSKRRPMVEAVVVKSNIQQRFKHRLSTVSSNWNKVNQISTKSLRTMSSLFQARQIRRTLIFVIKLKARCVQSQWKCRDVTSEFVYWERQCRPNAACSFWVDSVEKWNCWNQSTWTASPSLKTSRIRTLGISDTTCPAIPSARQTKPLTCVTW